MLQYFQGLNVQKLSASKISMFTVNCCNLMYGGKAIFHLQPPSPQVTSAEKTQLSNDQRTFLLL